MYPRVDARGRNNAVELTNTTKGQHAERRLQARAALQERLSGERLVFLPQSSSEVHRQRTGRFVAGGRTFTINTTYDLNNPHPGGIQLRRPETASICSGSSPYSAMERADQHGVVLLQRPDRPPGTRRFWLLFSGGVNLDMATRSTTSPFIVRRRGQVVHHQRHLGAARCIPSGEFRREKNNHLLIRVPLRNTGTAPVEQRPRLPLRREHPKRASKTKRWS